MAPFHDESGSSDDEGTPEAVSMSQSKRTVQKQEEQLNKARLAQKEKKKAENREKDRKLKARAEETRGKWRGDDLEARMARAMQEAEEEMARSDSEKDSEEELGGMASEGDSHDGNQSSDKTEDESASGSEGGSQFMGIGDEDEDMGSEEEESSEQDDGLKPKPKVNPNHLPDELFSAAFTSKSSSAEAKGKGKESKTEKAKKRKRTKSGPKGVIIGSRAVRTLQNSTRQIPSTLPSQKIKKFLDRTLALKGGNSKTRGWERRPVNIGILRHNGPATNFVRNR